jgi:hypothetical protein
VDQNEVNREFYRKEKIAIEDFISRLSDQMKKKMLLKMYRDHYYGFDQTVMIEHIFEQIKAHLIKEWDAENCIDICNLFGMLWNIHKRLEHVAL